MKTEELKAQGFTDEQISFIMAENGKDVNAAKADVANITAERDKWKAQADSATQTLEGYKGKSADELEAEIASWKAKAEETESTYRAQIAARDLSAKITEKLSTLKVKDDMRDIIMAGIKEAGAQLNPNGDLIGFDEAVEVMKQKRPSAFEAEDEGKKPTPKFTQKSPEDKKSDAEKWKALSLDERMRLKRENPELYSTMKQK